MAAYFNVRVGPVFAIASNGWGEVGGIAVAVRLWSLATLLGLVLQKHWGHS